MPVTKKCCEHLDLSMNVRVVVLLCKDVLFHQRRKGQQPTAPSVPLQLQILDGQI